MNDVNFNSLDLRLVRPVDSARAKASPQAEGSNVSAQSAIGNSVKAASSTPSQLASNSKPLTVQDEANGDQINNAVTKLNDFVQNVQQDLQFEVDKESGKTIVRVVDQKTQEVIRQIPDEVALRLARNLQQYEPLSLFDVKV